ncbi:MAG: hybrid sensor histidine kinase/response regulator [Coleofasciculaceae cyanobacterium]
MTNSGQDMGNFSMLDLFSMEVETQAIILNENLLAAEENPQSPQELESLMRAAHSIKGAARIVEIEAAVKIAHAMEDCFVAAQEGRIHLRGNEIDLLLVGVDLLLRISQLKEADLNVWLSQQAGEIENLVTAYAGMLGSETREAEETPTITSQIISEQENINLLELPSQELPSATRETEVSFEEVTTPEQETEESNQTKQLPLENISEQTTVEPFTKSDVHKLSFSDKTTSLELNSQAATQLTNRVVKVNAENLNSLMGLAGESLVEANWLQPFADSLLKLKQRQGELSSILDKLQESLEEKQLNQLGQEHLNAAQQKSHECRDILSERLNELEQFSRRFANLSDRLYREVIASHMRPFADGMKSFPRMIRDLAKQLGKKVKFEAIGKYTQVDRDILEKLKSPITHILRNAIDHGIELPEKRLAAGKPEEGKVRLEVSHRGGMLSVTISDDGKGIDLEKLRQKIVRKQLVNPEMASQLTENELMEFIFLPGFSTSRQVTEISGRGVGLDIAKSMVHDVGGHLKAISKPGKGMSFHFQLPLTLSVIRTLLVEIAEEPYAFPLTRVDQVLMIAKEKISVVENRQYFSLNEQNIGLVTAHQVLELKESNLNLEALPVVVISDNLNRYGLVVDRFLGERSLVVRPLEPRLGKVPDISAAALMEDGSPVLIIDVADLVRSIDKLLNRGFLSQVSQNKNVTSIKQQKTILVVDDSITVREMERKLLQNNGYQVDVAVNGMEGWNAVRTNHYDLVISDIDMPRMNGIELVGQIKNNPNLKSIPVIIVSYKDREEDRLQGLEAGANYYLTKSSFHDDSLLNAVIDLIGH